MRHAIVLFNIIFFSCISLSIAQVWPITGSSSANADVITSAYGPRIVTAGYQLHWGLDVRAVEGTDVHSIESGTINDGGGSRTASTGYWVEVLHGDNSVTRYLHLKFNPTDPDAGSEDPRFPISLGTTVSRGQLIAISGNTGGVPDHLHIYYFPNSLLTLDRLDAWNPLDILAHDETSVYRVQNFYWIPQGGEDNSDQIEFEVFVDPQRLDVNKIKIQISNTSKTNGSSVTQNDILHSEANGTNVIGIIDFEMRSNVDYNPRDPVTRTSIQEFNGVRIEPASYVNSDQPNDHKYTIKFNLDPDIVSALRGNIGSVIVTVYNSWETYSITSSEMCYPVYWTENWPYNTYNNNWPDQIKVGDGGKILIQNLNSSSTTHVTFNTEMLVESGGTLELQDGPNSSTNTWFYVNPASSPTSSGYNVWIKSGATLKRGNYSRFENYGKVKVDGTAIPGTGSQFNEYITISGTVREGVTGLSGVTMTATGSPTNTSTTTASDGTYSLTVSTPWTGTVTASKTDYTFSQTLSSPFGPTITYTSITTDQTYQDYTATPVTGPTVTISGTIREGGIGLGGVTMTATGSPTDTSTTTASDGTYSLTVSTPWTGYVIPSKTGYTFSPANQDYTNITTAQTKDYAATLVTGPTLTISGTVREGGIGLGGVLMTADGSPTNISKATVSDGTYSLTVSSPWTGTVTALRADYDFTQTLSYPYGPTITYTGITTDQIYQDYTATPITGPRVTISGYVYTPDNTPIEDVQMNASGIIISPMTDESGYYSLTVESGWTGTVNPTKPGYNFNPKDYDTPVTTDLTNENYFSIGSPPSSIEIQLGPSAYIGVVKSRCPSDPPGTWRWDYYFSGNNNPYAGNQNVFGGCTETDQRHRAFFRFDISGIPDDATVTRDSISIRKNTSSNDPTVKLVKVEIADFSTGSYDDLWIGAGSGTILASGITVNHSSGSYVQFNASQIQNSLTSDYITIAVVSENESALNTYLEILKNPELRISYTVPQRNITVRNNVNNDYNIGLVKINGDSSNSPFTKLLDYNSQYSIEASYEKFSNASKNWKFHKWEDDNSTNRERLITVINDRIYTAKFDPYYTISSSAGPNGTITPLGNAEVFEGSDQTFTITPITGFHIADVLVDGASIGVCSTYTFTNVTSNHTISALSTCMITASAGPNGTISPVGNVEVGYGSDQTFNITPEIGCIVADVIVDEVSVGVCTTYTFTNVTTNHTISALFILIAPDLICPAQNADSVQNPTFFSWLFPMEDANYRLQIATDSQFTSTSLFYNQISEYSSTQPMLDYNTKYYWRVRAVKNGYEGLWSEIRSFVTANGVTCVIYRGYLIDGDEQQGEWGGTYIVNGTNIGSGLWIGIFQPGEAVTIEAVPPNEDWFFWLWDRGEKSNPITIIAIRDNIGGGALYKIHFASSKPTPTLGNGQRCLFSDLDASQYDLVYYSGGVIWYTSCLNGTWIQEFCVNDEFPTSYQGPYSSPSICNFDNTSYFTWRGDRNVCWKKLSDGNWSETYKLSTNDTIAQPMLSGYFNSTYNSNVLYLLYQESSILLHFWLLSEDCVNLGINGVIDVPAGIQEYCVSQPNMGSNRITICYESSHQIFSIDYHVTLDQPVLVPASNDSALSNSSGEYINTLEVDCPQVLRYDGKTLYAWIEKQLYTSGEKDFLVYQERNADDSWSPAVVIPNWDTNPFTSLTLTRILDKSYLLFALDTEIYQAEISGGNYSVLNTGCQGYDPMVSVCGGNIPPSEAKFIYRINNSIPSRMAVGSILVPSLQTVVSLNAEWNLVSVPRVQTDYRVTTLFPGASGGVVYAFVPGSGYAPISILQLGIGYMAYYLAASEVTINGLASGSLTVSAQLRWNIIGSQATPVNIADIIISGGNSISGGVGYNFAGSGYTPIETIQPGQGVWIYIVGPSNTCTVTIP